VFHAIRFCNPFGLFNILTQLLLTVSTYTNLLCFPVSFITHSMTSVLLILHFTFHFFKTCLHNQFVVKESIAKSSAKIMPGAFAVFAFLIVVQFIKPFINILISYDLRPNPASSFILPLPLLPTLYKMYNPMSSFCTLNQFIADIFLIILCYTSQSVTIKCSFQI
jgi:hypothetical protein